MQRNIATKNLVCLLFLFVFHTNANEYEDEYKDVDKEPHNIGNSIDSDFASVTSDGKVMPFHWNPAERDLENEKPFEVIPKKKVVGGKDSIAGAVPYIVNSQMDGSIFCGGSIYNSKTILTAAHCYHSLNGKMPDSTMQSLTYVAGDLQIRVEEANEQKRKSVNVIIHPNYDPSKSFFDIAIVIVDKPFQYNKYVQPIPVDRPPLVPENVGKAHISGWGYTLKRHGRDPFHPKYNPNTLQEANVQVFTKDECYEFYGKQKKLKPLVDAGLICAGYKNGSIDGCQGDSGGPLACYNPKKRNRRYLCGIVATGVGCGLPGIPGFYTRVAEFHDWVIANAGYADKRTVDDIRDKI